MHPLRVLYHRLQLESPRQAAQDRKAAEVRGGGRTKEKQRMKKKSKTARGGEPERGKENEGEEEGRKGRQKRGAPPMLTPALDRTLLHTHTHTPRQAHESLLLFVSWPFKSLFRFLACAPPPRKSGV